jgi:hypothetical protein
MLQAFRQPESQRYAQEHPYSLYAQAPPAMEVCEPVRVAVPA